MKHATLKSSISAKVKDIIIERLCVNSTEVTESTNFQNDLGADSLDVVELIIDFEKEFDIIIEEEEAAEVNTVGDVINFIEWKILNPGKTKCKDFGLDL